MGKYRRPLDPGVPSLDLQVGLKNFTIELFVKKGMTTELTSIFLCVGAESWNARVLTVGLTLSAAGIVLISLSIMFSSTAVRFLSRITGRQQGKSRHIVIIVGVVLGWLLTFVGILIIPYMTYLCA